MAIIQLKDVKKTYGKNDALKSLDLDIETGSVTSILGSNGAGKSTTIKLICGLLKPTRGTVTIAGKSYKDDADAIKQVLGYVPEESAMYLDVTVMEYLLFFSRLYNLSDVESTPLIKEYARRLELEDAFDKRLSELSKGMRRKVLIIRSLLNDPSILIFDEPASGLDPQTSQTILSFIKEMKDKGKTVLFSSHNLSHVQQIAERVIILREGYVIADMSLHDLLKQHRKSFVMREREGGVVKAHETTLDNVKEKLRLDPESVVDISTKETSLEEVYLSLIKKE